MGKSQFDNALETIKQYFDHSNVKVFTQKSLQHIYLSKKGDWKITHQKTSISFIEYLQKKELLFPFRFTDQNGIEKVVYSWKTQDGYTLITGLKNNSYFSHQTALWLNKLIEKEPKTIYLNHEHKSEENSLFDKTLNQVAIDRVFSGNQRISNLLYTFENYKIQMLNGKGTNNLGVIRSQEKEQFFEYTDVERTLIDIAVRPIYAGGVVDVLEAYKNARSLADIKKLAHYLHKMSFIYPYHQVIGFYLEKAGYQEADLELFDTRMDYNFYLTYNIKNKLFSKRWQLYYSKELK